MMGVMAEYTREELVAICEAAIVATGEWHDRDSGKAHVQVGQCWALLKAGCDLRVITKANATAKDSGCVTDAETVWLEIRWRGFNAFELGDEDDDWYDEQTFYLPTRKRLEKVAGRDWY